MVVAKLRPLFSTDFSRVVNCHGFNKGRSSKFCKGCRVRQTPDECRRTYRSKRCENNIKNEDNSPKTLNDKNQQASSQKFRQLRAYIISSKNALFIGHISSETPMTNASKLEE